MANVLTNFAKRAVDLFANGSKSIPDTISALFSSVDQKSVNESTVLTITPAWRAIYILKDILSTMPLNLYQRTEDGDVILARDHKLNKLISVSPSPLYTPYEWMSAMMVNALISGNAISIIHRDGSSIPTLLELVPYDKLQGIYLVNEKGKSPHIEYVFQDGRAKHHDDVIHFQGLSIDGLSGLNITKTHQDTLATEAAMRDFIKSFLEKGAFLSGVIEVPVQLQDNTYKRMKTSWDDAYGGAKRAGGTAILEGGAKYQRIQATVPEAGYEIVKSASISDISRIYGVPEYMLDGKNKPTYASIEHISLDFKKYTIDGWCTKISQELTRKLVSSNQTGTFFFDYDKTGLTTGDLQTMGEYYTKLFRMGVISRNEARSFIKMNKVKDGDRYWIEGNNMLPVDAVDKMIEMKQQAGSMGKPSADVQTVTEK